MIYDNYKMFNQDIRHSVNGKSIYNSNVLPFSGGIMDQPRLFIKMIECKRLHEIKKTKEVQIR